MSHTCHATGCDKEVDPALLMCAKHWRMVPANLQRDVYRHYRPGQEADKRPSAEYLAAAKTAISAVEQRERPQLRLAL